MERAGFIRLKVDPQLLYHPEHKWLLVAHVDDLMIAAPIEAMAAVKKMLDVELKIKWGPAITSDLVTYLGREWRRTPRGYAVRVPPAHFEKILQERGLANCTAVCTPMDKGLGVIENPYAVMRKDDGKDELDAEQASLHRRAI